MTASLEYHFRVEIDQESALLIYIIILFVFMTCPPIEKNPITVVHFPQTHRNLECRITNAN